MGMSNFEFFGYSDLITANIISKELNKIQKKARGRILMLSIMHTKLWTKDYKIINGRYAKILLVTRLVR